VTQIVPSKIKLISIESERNTVIHLSKSAKKLVGEETRTILLNRHKTIPSNRIPNTSEVYVRVGERIGYCSCSNIILGIMFMLAPRSQRV
jgi:hypothetical protein